MTSTTISRSYAAKPSKELHVLLSALSDYMNTDGSEGTWEDQEALVGALMRAARFGDACRRCWDREPGTLQTRYPYRLDPGGESGWVGLYRCHVCEDQWRVGWADLLH